MPTDFHWVETDEPHATRRRLILEKHPEIATLITKEPRTFWIVLGIVIAQLISAWVVKDLHWGWLLLWAYVFGGTVNHSLQLAVHEISHNTVFESEIANKLTGFLGNTVTGFPSSITFRRYHMDHHRFQGVDGIDTDVPTMAEVRFFRSPLRKALWMLLQPAFYGLRPLIVKPKPITAWEAANLVVQLAFNAVVVHYMGWKALAYLIAGTLLGLGLHPVAGHFIAEHYEFTKGHETYSYYGILNYVNFNVGYHQEHHDFPRIPWSNLPRVREMAPEFYKDLPYYTSYVWVIWNYITNPNVGPASRIKRPATKVKGITSAGPETAE